MEEAAIAQPVIHTVGDMLMQTGYVLGPRRIPDYELVYFPEGTGTVYELEGRPIALDKPGFLLSRPNEEHRYLFDPAKNVRHLFAHFDFAAFDEPDGPYRALLTQGDWLPVGTSQLVPGLMKQMLRVANAQGPRWKERMSMLLLAAIEELQAAADGTGEEPYRLMPAQITRAIAYMEEHLAEPITIEEIARQSGWSHEHFTRLFVSCVGISPKRALLDCRLRKAEQLMMTGAWTVKQIAYKVGFGDEHHFSKMYKSVRGMTASEYVARCKDPLFRHTAPAADPDTPYPLNRYVVVNV